MEYKMNKYEEYVCEKEIIRRFFSYSYDSKNPVLNPRQKKRKKESYEKLTAQLKLLKELKEKKLQPETNNEEKYSYIEPIYTDEDKEFLKQAVRSGELTIVDLTFEEALMVGFTGEDYRRAERKILKDINLSKNKEKQFNDILAKMHKPTPNVINFIYKKVQKKK